MLRVPPVCGYFRRCHTVLYYCRRRRSKAGRSGWRTRRQSGRLHRRRSSLPPSRKAERDDPLTPPPEHPITSATNALGWALYTILTVVVSRVVRGRAVVRISSSGWTGRAYSYTARIWGRLGQLHHCCLLDSFAAPYARAHTINTINIVLIASHLWLSRRYFVFL